VKRLLIVSPHFPPVNAPDLHRVRLSLPYFAEFGWQPHVLSVAAVHQPEAALDPFLRETLPADVAVTEVGAWPLAFTRRLGVGNVAIRAFTHLHRAGARLMRDTRFDLVFFSTTMFFALPLGRLWKRRFGLPYVLDMQDPWASDYRPSDGSSARGKGAFARRLHGLLEPLTLRRANGLIAVSPAYIQTLRRRYPKIPAELCATVPFGASERDFEAARRVPWRNDFFDRADPRVHGVAVGCGGAAMATAARILFAAVARIRATTATPMHLWFIGTDYAPAGRGRRTISPVARAEGIDALVHETPDRVPYLTALRLLDDASFLIVLGSDDPAYSPSKVYSCLLSRKPIVAVLHEASPVVDLLRRAGSIVVTFTGSSDVAGAVDALAPKLGILLDRLPCETTTDDAVLAPFGAAELTRQQCALFDAVVARSRAGERR